MPPRTLPDNPGNPRLTPAPHPYRHYLRLQTRFTDFDMLGHMNNNIYMSFMDMGKADYFKSVMQGNVNWNDPGLVVVNINCDYFAPVFPDEPVELFTTVTRLGEHSIHLDQRIVNADTLETKCVARTVMAGFDIRTATSKPIAPEWIEAIERFEERSYSKPES